MLLHAFHSTYSGGAKISKFDILIQNSLKYLSKELQIIKALLETFGMQYCKAEVKNSAKPCHFPYKIVRPIYKLLLS